MYSPPSTISGMMVPDAAIGGVAAGTSFFFLGNEMVCAFHSWCCQGMSKTGSVLNVQVPAELQHICKGSLKGNRSLLNAWAEMRRKLSSHSTQVQLYITGR